MTIPNTARKAGPLLGTGSQTAWPFTFKVFAAGDVQVSIANSSGVETLLVLNTDYTVSLNANQETSPGGTVTYPISGSALPVGSVLAIIGDLDYDQPLDLPSGGNFSPTALENQLDRSTMQIQQLREEMNRTAKLPPTSSESVEALVDDLQRIADSADNLDTVADNIADINTVASDLNEPVSEINTVAGSIANVNTVGANITNVNTVAGISANVTTVAGIQANVTTVAGIAANVTAVAGNATNINAVAGNATNINAVAANETNIDAVAANEASIDTVAGISAAVSAVAAIDDDVSTVAANVAGITNFADVYQGPKTSDPTLRNDGSALQAGDLYFNTVDNALRAYSGTSWVAGTAGTINVQRFSGDSSDTTFTLASAPAGENNTQVYIGGVYQQKDTYSLSGSTITFGSAPPTGTDNIEVVTIATLALGETDASLVTFLPAGTGVVERTAQSKLREVVSVEDFGAVGDGVTDDAAAILKAFNHSRTIGGAEIVFPQATYLLSHGFNVPSNTVVRLNGSTFRATTTYAQGTIPTNGAISFFEISHRTPFGADPDIKNIAIIGDGALIDGRRDEQTGTPQGYDGVLIETSDTPQQADLWKINNIFVSDLNIDRIGYDGVYVSGAADYVFKNVHVTFALRIGIAVIASKNGRFIDCEGSYTVGDNPGLPAGQQGPGNSGDGYWNEPNYTWQTIDVKYLNCYAEKNWQSGFKPYNAGADASFFIELIACKGFDNCWDEVTSTRRSAPAEANFRVSLNATASASAYLLFKDCVTQTSERSGFSIQRGAASGTGSVQRIIVDNLVVMDCNRSNTNGVNRSPIYVASADASGYPLIVFNNPTVVATYNNTAGYGIAIDDPTNVFVMNPVFAGVFTEQLYITGTLPGSRTTNRVPNFLLDPGADQSPNGIAGDITKFYKPVRLASWDQTSQPSTASELFANELAVWQDDSDQFVAIYKRDDSDTPKYIDMQRKKRIRGSAAYAGGTIANGTQVTLTVTITGAELGDIVQASYTADLVRCFVFGYVESANSVKLIISNNSGADRTVPAGSVVANIIASDF